MIVHDQHGDIEVYAPRHGAPADAYSIDAFEKPGGPHTILYQSPTLIRVCAAPTPHDRVVPEARSHCPAFKRQFGRIRYLLRGAADTAMDLSTNTGNVNVEDYNGIVNARVGHGDVKMLIPKYANASVGVGNVSIIFSSTDWPGTLRYRVRRGDVELYVNENAKAQIRLHTDNGTIFSDFPLRGTSHGSSETIDGVLNGGAARAIDVRVHHGSIRILQLKPQI